MEVYKYIIISSHRRSGTHFLIDTLFNNFKNIKNGYINLDRLQPFHKDTLSILKFKSLISNRKKILFKTHSFGDFSTFQNTEINRFIKKEILPFAKIIYISREGKDVLNSLFFYLKSKGDKFENFTEFLYSINSFDNVGNDLNRLEFFKEHQNSWSKMDNLFKTGYEDLKTDLDNELKKIAIYLKLSSKKNIFKAGIKKYNLFQRALRRVFPFMFRSTAILPRKGVVGDWKNNFSEEDLKYYNKICGNKDI